MIPERPFWTALARRHVSLQYELRFGRHGMRAEGLPHHRDTLARQQGRYHEFPHVFRERSDRRENQSGRTSQKN